MIENVKEYLKAGLSLIPVDSTKRPPVVAVKDGIELRMSWEKYKETPITFEEFEYKFKKHNAFGAGVVCGKVSGNLECLDIDCKNDKDGNLWAEFCALVEDQSPGLLRVLFIETTISGGYHIVYRLRDDLAPGNTKLASNKEGEVLIETRGEGGYFVCAPTQGYSVWQGSLLKLPCLSMDEREILISVAKSLDCIQEESQYQHKQPPVSGYNGITPFDDYDSDPGNMFDLLESKQWKVKQGRNNSSILTRPGKESGISATFNQKNRAGLPNRLFIFSSSVKELPNNVLLKPSAVYTILLHGGDFEKSASQLYKEGYGDRVEEVLKEKIKELEKDNKIVVWKNQYNPSYIAKRFMEGHSPLYYIREEYYQFNGVCYEVLPEDSVRADIKKFLDLRVILQDKNGVFPIDVTKDRIANILVNVSLSVIADYENNQIIGESLKDYNEDKLIILRNGIFDIDSQKLIPHNPDYFSTIALNLEYNPNAECPTWSKYIDSQVDLKSQNLIQEWFGYNLIKKNDKQKYMVFYGLPGSGKSTALEVLQELVGAGNYSAFTFAGMASEFGLSHYVNKQAIFSGDAHLSSLSSEKFTSVLERLKGITGGDLIEINRKGLPFISMKLPLKITFNVNEVPRFNDKANALMRRLLVVQFPNIVKEKDQDDSLKETFRKELAGIFNWAVSGLANLESYGVFSFNDEELKTEFRESNNPLQSFINECCVLEGDVLTKELYDVWKVFCEQNGYREGSSSSLGVGLASLGIKKERHPNGKREYFYKGIDIDRSV